MIWLTIAAGLPAIVLTVMLRIEAFNSGIYPRWLFAAIPVLLLWPAAIYGYGSTLTGYATTNTLPDGFVLISSYADESRKAIYATVRLKDETEPRLYAVTGDFEANRKSFAKAQGDVGKGLPIAGKQKRTGLQNDGEFVFYVLPPSGLPDKG